MTEYDYSPGAYERYLETQQRIARWVDETEGHRPEFKLEGNRPSSQGHTRRGQSHSMQINSPGSSEYCGLPGRMPLPTLLSSSWPGNQLPGATPYGRHPMTSLTPHSSSWPNHLPGDTPYRAHVSLSPIIDHGPQHVYIGL